MNFGKTVFVVNPHAGNGETGREWPRIKQMARDILGSFESCLTEGPGDATRMTRDHLLTGADRIVCVGGDGTLNEVINGFLDENGPLRRDAVLGFLPNGTGCDFCRTMPIPAGVEASLLTVRENHIRTIDLGLIRYRDHQGGVSQRYFHNIASFGLGGEVVDRVNKTSKACGPFLTFIWGTLVSLFAYGKKRISLKVDDGNEWTGDVLNIAIANGRYHGGGMLVAPDAITDDGLFHVTVIGAMILPMVFWHLPKLYTGKIKTIRQVSMLTGKRVFASSEQRVLLDVDGEQPGTLPAEMEIVPGALKMIMKKSA
ncbi:MAG: diacylglycerol kinase family lipid kinase [Proteobacteria bacterium]|nr:diacylglycerol kinase family lipid kinase [Pseudomonadota bacterium]MBU2226459.1 diacylglycerol kinase family lipid kinase [Pseudomonadota bacterium]MBU2261028.1 diacylglycerol kinase family lipid kinase [Pseudomonadota bacterium]